LRYEIARNISIFSKLASDGVTFSDLNLPLPWTDNAEVIDIINFEEGHYVPLVRLAVLARCVHNKAVEYNVLTQNCYFFAHVTCEALKELHPKHTLPPAQGKAKQGTWNGLPVALLFDEGMVKKVVESFNDEMAMFDLYIHEAVNNTESDVFVAEQAKRQEAEGREKEERRKREEAERIAAEAERIAAEAERIAAEAERIAAEAERNAAEAERNAAEKDEKIRRLEAMLEAQAGKST